MGRCSRFGNGHPPVATLPASGLMVVDSQLNAAYVLELPFNAGNATIDTIDLTHFVKTGSITITGVNGTAGRLIRWGENGLAFNTSDGHVFLIGGNIVSRSFHDNAAGRAAAYAATPYRTRADHPGYFLA